MQRSILANLTLPSVSIPLLMLLVACGGASRVASVPATTVRLAEYEESSGVTESIRKECNLQEQLPEFVSAAAEGVEVGTEDVPGRVLELRITGVTGVGGGSWTGAKTLVVEGTLKQDGSVVGTFTGRRTTTGGAFAAFKGTCSLLGRDAKSLGRDIAQWLAEPTMDARLGEL